MIKRLRDRIPMGTRTLLFGAHQVFLHPIFVFISWWKLYGFPKHPALYVAFIVHDWGYWGKPKLDDADGELHPIMGGKILGRLFGQEWYDFCTYHSRFLARRDGKPFSRLCVADKLAIIETPRRLYLPLIRLSGEEQEYIEGRKEGGKYGAMPEGIFWYDDMVAYLKKWVPEHKDKAYETWETM